MLSPLPRRSDWAYCFAHFTQPCQPSPIWQSGRPAHCPFRGLLGVHSRYGLHTRAVTVFRDTLSEGFSHFVTSIAAPVASGWSGCRVGFAPTGKRRLFTAHASSGLMHCDKVGAVLRVEKYFTAPAHDRGRAGAGGNCRGSSIAAGSRPPPFGLFTCTLDGVSARLSSRRDVPSKRAFSSIANDR